MRCMVQYEVIYYLLYLFFIKHNLFNFSQKFSGITVPFFMTLMFEIYGRSKGVYI